MTIQANIHQAKTEFSKLVNRALAGDEVIIARSGKPIIRLIPYHDSESKRIPDTARGQISMNDDFDAPLDDKILRDFWQ